MKYQTISEKDCLYYAYYGVFEKYLKEQDRKQELNKAGKASPIADYRIEKYEKQLDELHKAICAMEADGQVHV